MASVTAFRGGFVAVGYDRANGASAAAVWTSTDGTSWDRVEQGSLAGSGAELSMSDVVADGDRLLAGGTDGTNAAVWISDDGERWSRTQVAAFQAPTGESFEILGLGIQAGATVAVGTVTVDADTDATSWRSEPS
jgi:hypothetical protein